MDRQQRLASYRDGFNHIKAALRDLPQATWKLRPIEDEWTIHEILMHLADAEVHGYIRLRFGLAQPGKAIMSYDESLWTANLNYHAQSATAALDLFAILRSLSFQLVDMLPEASWSNTFEHEDAGTITLDQWLEIYDDHVNAHTQQIRTIAAALQSPE